MTITEAPIGADLIMKWLDLNGKHKDAGICPGCQQELDAIAMVKLAYVFDECGCGTPEYVHLVEQLWHRTCLEWPWQSACAPSLKEREG